MELVLLLPEFQYFLALDHGHHREDSPNLNRMHKNAVSILQKITLVFYIFYSYLLFLIEPRMAYYPEPHNVQLLMWNRNYFQINILIRLQCQIHHTTWDIEKISRSLIVCVVTGVPIFNYDIIFLHLTKIHEMLHIWNI